MNVIEFKSLNATDALNTNHGRNSRCDGKQKTGFLPIPIGESDNKLRLLYIIDAFTQQEQMLVLLGCSNTRHREVNHDFSDDQNDIINLTTTKQIMVIYVIQNNIL